MFIDGRDGEKLTKSVMIDFLVEFNDGDRRTLQRLRDSQLLADCRAKARRLQVGRK